MMSGRRARYADDDDDEADEARQKAAALAEAMGQSANQTGRRGSAHKAAAAASAAAKKKSSNPFDQGSDDDDGEEDEEEDHRATQQKSKKASSSSSSARPASSATTPARPARRPAHDDDDDDDDVDSSDRSAATSPAAPRKVSNRAAARGGEDKLDLLRELDRERAREGAAIGSSKPRFKKQEEEAPPPPPRPAKEGIKRKPKPVEKKQVEEEESSDAGGSPPSKPQPSPSPPEQPLSPLPPALPTRSRASAISSMFPIAQSNNDDSNNNSKLRSNSNANAASASSSAAAVNSASSTPAKPRKSSMKDELTPIRATTASSSSTSASAASFTPLSPAPSTAHDVDDDDKDGAASVDNDVVSPLEVSPSSSSSLFNEERSRLQSIAALQKSLDVAGVKRLLSHIPQEFQAAQFNPFAHWNEPKETLEEWLAYTDMAVEKIVDAYHKGFNTATTAFSKVLANFSGNQKLIRKLQEQLAESKRLLQSRNQNLKDYYFQNLMQGKMKEILLKMRYVLEVPRWLDAYYSKKQYVHFVVLLKHALSMLVSEDLVGVEALSELREELLNRKYWIQQFLIEELHRIIYSKQEGDENLANGGGGGTGVSGGAGSAQADPLRISELQRIHLNKYPFRATTRSYARARDDSSSSFSTAGAGLSSMNMSDQGVPVFNAEGRRIKQVASALVDDGSDNRNLANENNIQSKLTPYDCKYSPFYQAASAFMDDDEEEADDGSSSSSSSSKSSPSSSPPIDCSPPFPPVLQSLLQDELSDSYSRSPEANLKRFLGLLVEALSLMNSLPVVRTHLANRVRSELLAILSRETALSREKSRFVTGVRRLAQRARATESGFLTQGSELLVELSENMFHILAQVLRNHLDVIQMIEAKLGGNKASTNNRNAASGSSTSNNTSVVTSSGSSGTVSDPKFTIEGVWQVMQIVLQTMLTDYLHSGPNDKRGKGGAGAAAADSKANANAAAALKAAKGKKSAPTDILSELSFSFDENNVPSVAKLSRGEKTGINDYRGKLCAMAKNATNNAAAIAADLTAQAMQQWIQATPYNITAVYRPVVMFSEQANMLIRKSKGLPAATSSITTAPSSTASPAVSSSSPSPSPSPSAVDDDSESHQLRNFLKVFIEVSFLPRVEADVNIRLDEVLNDPAAFDAREVQRDARLALQAQAALAAAAGDNEMSQSNSNSFLSFSSSSQLRYFPSASLEHNLLFKCILDLSEVLQKNISDMYLLPHSMNEYLRIIAASVNRVMEKCNDKFYRELVAKYNTAPTAAAATTLITNNNTALSASLFPGCTPPPQHFLLKGDPRYLALLEDDPLWKLFTLGAENFQSQCNMAFVDFEEEMMQYFSERNNKRI